MFGLMGKIAEEAEMETETLAAILHEADIFSTIANFHKLYPDAEENKSCYFRNGTTRLVEERSKSYYREYKHKK